MDVIDRQQSVPASTEEDFPCACIYSLLPHDIKTLIFSFLPPHVVGVLCVSFRLKVRTAFSSRLEILPGSFQKSIYLFLSFARMMHVLHTPPARHIPGNVFGVNVKMMLGDTLVTPLMFSRIPMKELKNLARIPVDDLLSTPEVHCIRDFLESHVDDCISDILLVQRGGQMIWMTWMNSSFLSDEPLSVIGKPGFWEVLRPLFHHMQYIDLQSWSAPLGLAVTFWDDGIDWNEQWDTTESKSLFMNEVVWNKNVYMLAREGMQCTIYPKKDQGLV